MGICLKCDSTPGCRQQVYLASHVAYDIGQIEQEKHFGVSADLAE
jgi:hypothetical protein